MAHERERKLLFDYRDFINDLYNGRWLTEAEKQTYLEHVENFLSTLPEEKEEKKKIICPKLKACISEPGVKCPDYDVICPI